MTRVEQLRADLEFNQEQYKLINQDLVVIMDRINLIKRELDDETDPLK